MTYISADLRRLVIKRANQCCEYCLVNQEDRSFPFEVDHIIAEKHLGTTSEDNLAWACYLCNGYKGSDLGSIDWNGTGKLTPLYNPRQEKWGDHFRVNYDNGEIETLSPQGRV